MLRARPGTRRSGARSRLLSAGALAVLAPWPAAGPTLAFLQLLLGPANATFSGQFLLGILDPANELVAGQRRDVLPGIECRGVGGQRLAQVCRKLVHHPTGHSAAHRATVVKRANPTSLGPHQWFHAENAFLGRAICPFPGTRSLRETGQCSSHSAVVNRLASSPLLAGWRPVGL